MSCQILKTVVALVGLPARGKTYISKKMTRYFNWNGVCTKDFIAEDYRSNVKNCDESMKHCNPEAEQIKNKAIEEMLKDMFTWLKSEEAEMAVFDATNTTRERRAKICTECKENGIKIIFLESICDDEAIIETNIFNLVKDHPRYAGLSREKSTEDVYRIINHYESDYEPLNKEFDKELSFIQIFNEGRNFVTNNVHGYLQSKIMYYLMNIRPSKHTFYISRHGESEMNVLGRIGGNSNLSENGQKYAEKLGEYINTSLQLSDLKVFTSCLKRTNQTAKHIKVCNIQKLKALNEIDAGKCDELTYEQVEKLFPVEFAERDDDKYRYRYPKGESYQDLVARLEPVIMQLEHEDNTLMVCHQAVARCLLAYFLDKTVDELPYIKMPLHTLVKLTPTAYGCEMETIPMQVASVDTQRDKTRTDI